MNFPGRQRVAGLLPCGARSLVTQIYDRGLLKPPELAKLQRVFDAACRERNLEPGSEAARDMALTLLALFNAGMTDEDILLGAVDVPRQARPDDLKT